MQGRRQKDSPPLGIIKPHDESLTIRKNERDRAMRADYSFAPARQHRFHLEKRKIKMKKKDLTSFL
jgi:hypothetical protein